MIAIAYAKELLSVIPSDIVGNILAVSKLPKPNSYKNLHTFSHDDYTVRLTYTRPLELTTTIAILDEIHENLPTLSLDSNIYTLGRIGIYNVIISYYPPELYSIVSAGIVAT